MNPVANFALQSTLLISLFRFRPSDQFKRSFSKKSEVFFNQHFNQQDLENETLLQAMRKEFSLTKTIQRMSFYAANFLCDRNYKRLLLKSRSALTKELDLKKFIIRQRLQTTAILGLLTGQQSFFVDKMS